MNMKKEWNWMLDFIKGWEDYFPTLAQEQLKALWTSFCLRYDLVPDTKEYDWRLDVLFQEILKIDEECTTFVEFDEFMVEYLV